MEPQTSRKDHSTGTLSRDGCRNYRERMHPQPAAKRTEKIPPLVKRHDSLNECVSSETEERAYRVHRSGMRQPGHVVTCTSNDALRGGIDWHGDTPIYRPILERESKRQKRYTFVKDSGTHLDSLRRVCEGHTQPYFQNPSLENAITGKEQLVNHLHHTSSWKGLTSDQASDVARLETTFSDVLESIMDEYLRAILPSTAIPHLHLGTYTIPIYLGTVVVRMLDELEKHPSESSWAIALGDIRSTLVKFICLHDWFWSTPPNEKPNLLMTTIRLVFAQSPFNTTFDYAPTLQMLPISAPEYIKLEGQIPSPVNEGRQIIVIPNYVSPIFGTKGASTTSDREISFVSRTSWLKWNDLLRSFVGIVPFRFAHESQNARNDGAESIYTSYVDIEGVCTIKVGSTARFERKITCQMILQVRPRVLFQDAGTSTSSGDLDAEGHSLADMRCSRIIGSSTAKRRHNLQQHGPCPECCEGSDDPLQNETRKGMNNEPLVTGMRHCGQIGSDSVAAIGIKSALLDTDTNLGGSPRYATARHPPEDAIDEYTRQALESRRSPQCFHASPSAMIQMSPGQMMSYCAAPDSFDSQSNSDVSTGQSNMSSQMSPQPVQGSQDISPTRTIRNQSGKVWTIDDSYLIKKKDKPRFFDMLRTLSRKEAPTSPALDAQVDSLESFSSISSMDSGETSDGAEK
ncbi:hypothetical protein KEM54_002842 [Ascosphaera aggregata]|nr:hypothetical protein KEM54_002842 [Ascosphaera aggregata]